MTARLVCAVETGEPLHAIDLEAIAPAVANLTLVIHDRDDAVVEIADVRAAVAALRAVSLVETHGLGHSRILRASEVVRRVVGFVARMRSTDLVLVACAVRRRYPRAVIEFADASAPPLLEVARDLFREYQVAIQVDLCFQGFEGELASLPGAYAPPAGRLVVVLVDGTPAGCGALRPLVPAVAELKRMWVRPAFRGRGVGRSIAGVLLRAADDLGYRAVRLDTLESMKEARSLYADLGFREIPAYYDNPLPGVIYMERALGVTLDGRR